MDAVEVIRTKRDGGRLSDEQIGWFIGRYAEGGVIADEQAAALAMAIFFKGMEPDELATWTRAMVDSGRTLDLSGVGRPTVDKHSTGGVGDKVSLVLVPLVAACGAAVPQLSGRGLGHTGGTLDKMESIPGWSATLDPAAMVEVLRTVGGVIAGATEDLAPADRRLYALRDVTSTVDSIPLIASSIMSKKIAEGTESLVLDVKVGSGAFLPEVDRARELAQTMVGLGEHNGVRTVALLTAMDTVLGRTAGNALEVAESVEVLDGGGPPDLVEVTLALAGEMVALAGLDADPAEVLASGRARRCGTTWCAPRVVTRLRRCRSPHMSRPSSPMPPGCSGDWTACRSESPHGAWAPGGPARRTRSARVPESCAWPSRAIQSRSASRCSNSTPTTRPGLPQPGRHSRAPSRYPTSRRPRCP
jgi:thymidine phosphorylase